MFLPETERNIILQTNVIYTMNEHILFCSYDTCIGDTNVINHNTVLLPLISKTIVRAVVKVTFAPC